MNNTYRKATIEDKKVLYDLGVQLNTYNLAHDIKENLFWEGWEQDIEQEVEEEIKDESISVYIAENPEKRAVGFIIAINFRHHGYFEIDQLFVSDEYRGQNIGKKLLDCVAEEARKLGVKLKLEVYQSNEKAINFYRKYGFKETGVVMSMDL